MNAAPICPYCHRVAKLRRVSSNPIWVCLPCRARIEAHPVTFVPLGTLANRGLRKAREGASRALARLWEEGYCTRDNAHILLVKILKLHENRTSINTLNDIQCSQVIEKCTELIGE